jgi:threonyl-tRNA synthetase
LWLSPVQVVILPISDRHNDYAKALANRLRGYDSNAPVQNPLRVDVDARRETLGKKIRENQMQKVPYMLILGDRDIEQGTVGVRSREKGDLGAMSVEAFLERIYSEL